jgi:hypothetical protein
MKKKIHEPPGPSGKTNSKEHIQKYVRYIATFFSAFVTETNCV